MDPLNTTKIRSLKIFLGIAFFLLIILAVVLIQKGILGGRVVTEDTSATSTASQSKTVPTIPMEDAVKQFKLIQDQVSAGTLSVEEANKQIAALGTQVAPPPLPPEIQKQIDAAKKAPQ